MEVENECSYDDLKGPNPQIVYEKEVLVEPADVIRNEVDHLPYGCLAQSFLAQAQAL